MSITTTHTSGMFWKYAIETNYAGGPAGAAYAATAPANDAALTACNQPFNETQTMPWGYYEKVAEEGAGQGASTKVTFTKSYKVKDGKIVQYMQNTTWIDLAIATSGGALPSSFLLHWEEGQVEYTSYGCYISEYKLSGTKEDYLKEELTIKAFSTETEDVTGFAVAWQTTAAANFEDVGAGGTVAVPKITVTNGTPTTYGIVALEDISLTITNTHLEGAFGGSYFNKFAYLDKRDVEIEMTHLDYIAPLVREMSAYSSTLDLYTINIEDFGYAEFNATNMKIKPESTNISDIPEKGMKRYKVTYEIGGTSVFTTP